MIKLYPRTSCHVIGWIIFHTQQVSYENVLICLTLSTYVLQGVKYTSRAFWGICRVTKLLELLI